MRISVFMSLNCAENVRRLVSRNFTNLLLFDVFKSKCFQNWLVILDNSIPKQNGEIYSWIHGGKVLFKLSHFGAPRNKNIQTATYFWKFLWLDWFLSFQRKEQIIFQLFFGFCDFLSFWIIPNRSNQITHKIFKHSLSCAATWNNIYNLTGSPH